MQCKLHLVRRPPQSANSADGSGPCIDGLPTPHPEPGGDPHRQDHEVLEHQHGEVRGGSAGEAVRAEQGPLPPEKHKSKKNTKQKKRRKKHKKYKEWEIPRERGCLIEAARNDSSSGDDVEDGEDPDLHHQLLQLVNLGPTLLFLDNAPDQACFSQRDRGRNNLILKSEMNPAERKETPRIR